MPEPSPNASPSQADWSALARIGELARAPRPDWPATIWPGVAASLGVHGLAGLMMLGIGAGWVIALYPPRHDTSSAASRRGSTITIVGQLAPADERPASPVAVKLDALPRPAHHERAVIETKASPIAAEVEFDPIEWSEPAPQPAPSATERANPAEPPAAPRPQHEPAPLPRTAQGGSPSLPGTVDSRAARGTKSNTPPQAIFSPEPIYPPELLAARRTGRVLVRVRILPAGTVAEAAVHETSRYAAFDRAALEAVRKWRFAPIAHAPAGGIEAIVPVRFEIVEP